MRPFCEASPGDLEAGTTRICFFWIHSLAMSVRIAPSGRSKMAPGGSDWTSSPVMKRRFFLSEGGAISARCRQRALSNGEASLCFGALASDFVRHSDGEGARSCHASRERDGGGDAHGG